MTVESTLLIFFSLSKHFSIISKTAVCLLLEPFGSFWKFWNILEHFGTFWKMAGKFECEFGIEIEKTSSETFHHSIFMKLDQCGVLFLREGDPESETCWKKFRLVVLNE